MITNLCLALLVIAVAVVGCGKGAVPRENELHKAFVQAPEDVKMQIAKAETAFRATNYLAGVLALNQLLEEHKLSADEKTAVGETFRHVTREITANPALDGPELFKARSELMQKLYGPM